MSPPAAPPSPTEPLIDGRFAVDIGRPLAWAAGGLAAFAAADRRDGRAGLMAVQVRPNAPPRAQALAALSTVSDTGVLLPLACGAAPGPDRRPAQFVVCTAPAGVALWPPGAPAPRAWSDADLMGRLLRPAAMTLALLAEHRVSHRAIRPDNLFLSRESAGIVLGCAWASPPASLQPALFEPPYVAMCPGPARGDGTIADDIYALGVVMLVLATGRLPLPGLDDDAIIRRKLELGCFQALAGEARLSPLVADLVKGMLAPDPQHRPPPALLADPAAARVRHVAARPPRRATRPLEIGGALAWDARTLGFAIARAPAAGLKVLRLGVVDHWLRRVLGDATLAARVEDAVTRRGAEANPADTEANARLVFRAVAMLDPLAPLVWNGLAIWPDGFGPALAAAEPGTAAAGMLEQAIACEAVGDWAGVRAEHCDAPALRAHARQMQAVLRQRGWAGGLPRLIYGLNPLLPCRSPVLAGAQVAWLGELLAALEAAAARPEVRTQQPIDREVAAFIAARPDQRLDGDILALTEPGPPGTQAVRQLALLADLQSAAGCGPLPELAGWLAGLAAPALDAWHSHSGRQAQQAALAAAVPTGDLAAVLAVLDDPAALAADERAYQQAQARLRRIDARLADLGDGGTTRGEVARRLGQEIAAALGLAMLAATAVAAVLR